MWKEHETIDRDKLGNFINGYIDSALETAYTDWFNDGVPFNEQYTKYDLSERALCQMIRDCLAFYRRHRAVLEILYETDYLEEHGAGFCFWKSRNGYDGGFGDEDSFGIEWDILQNGARGFGPFRLTIENGEVDADYYSRD